MEDKIKCSECGSDEWKAIESFTALTPCTLTREDGLVQVEFDMRSELARDAATSVTLAYTCANEECGNTIDASSL